MISYWIGVKDLPVTLVDGAEFRDVLKHVNPQVELSFLQVKVPSSKKVTDIIGTTAEKALKHIKVCLQNCRQITITTDLWSTKCSNQSFIGVTSHAFNAMTRKRQSFKL